MPEYFIPFYGRWVPDLPIDELRARGLAVRALREEMRSAGVLIYTGGVDTDAPAFSITPGAEGPDFTEHALSDSDELIGGFALIDVDDEASARYWAGRITQACGWPQQVHPMLDPHHLDEQE
jgi:hypothetical protein